jgi:hypothetical protein
MDGKIRSGLEESLRWKIGINPAELSVLGFLTPNQKIGMPQ